MKLELKRWLTAPLRMNRRQALILCIFLAIFAGALFVRLSVTFTHGIPLGRDGPYNMYNTVYVTEHWPAMKVTDPPLFFHFGALTHVTLSSFGSSQMSSFHVATSLASGLVALTVFLMMRRLTKNSMTALAAAFFAAFVPASFRVMGELQKNAFGVALAPLFVFFLWRGLEGGRKLDLLIAGIALGVVGLTHELVFGTLVIACICYLAFLLAYRRRIPWRELKAAIIIAIPVAIICGYFYLGKVGSIAGMTGGEKATILMAQGEQQLPEGQPMEPTIYRFYDEYIGQLLLVLAAIGAGVAAYRRKATDLFLLAWGMSALIMAQHWVIFGYQWRFVIMLATPVALLAAVGLVEGIGRLLWKAGENLRALFSEVRPAVVKGVTTTGRVVILLLLLFVVVQQARASYDYAWTGEMLQPQITTEEYEALQEFHEQVGDAYVFGSDKYLYWVDLAGLKGQIENGAVWELSYQLGGMPGAQSSDSLNLANQWYTKQQDVGENIYALASTGGPGSTQVLENEQLFKLIFSRSSLSAYALDENFSPPEKSPPLSSSGGAFALAAEQPPNDQQPPEGQQGGEEAPTEAPLVLKILLAPVYVLPGAARFVVGVPLTVLLWVFLPCLVWEAIRRITSSEKLEKLRKGIIVGVVAVLALAVALAVGGYGGRGMGPEPGPGPGPGEAPPGFEFVEGDKESWSIGSAKMGEEVLSPSWFRFEYLSEGPSLRCRQFGSLGNAKSNIGSLGEAVVAYTDGAPGGYTFAFGEGAASVDINLSLSNCPPTGHVIYKYEEAQMP